MNIYVEVMTIYGITFLVSMFVAFLIWALAKLVDLLPEESFTLKEFIASSREKMNANKAERMNFVRQMRENKESANLKKITHEHA